MAERSQTSQRVKIQPGQTQKIENSIPISLTIAKYNYSGLSLSNFEEKFKIFRPKFSFRKILGKFFNMIVWLIALTFLTIFLCFEFFPKLLSYRFCNEFCNYISSRLPSPAQSNLEKLSAEIKDLRNRLEKKETELSEIQRAFSTTEQSNYKVKQEIIRLTEELYTIKNNHESDEKESKKNWEELNAEKQLTVHLKQKLDTVEEENMLLKDQLKSAKIHIRILENKVKQK